MFPCNLFQTFMLGKPICKEGVCTVKPSPVAPPLTPLMLVWKCEWAQSFNIVFNCIFCSSKNNLHFRRISLSSPSLLTLHRAPALHMNTFYPSQRWAWPSVLSYQTKRRISLCNSTANGRQNLSHLCGLFSQWVTALYDKLKLMDGVLFIYFFALSFCRQLQCLWIVWGSMQYFLGELPNPSDKIAVHISSFQVAFWRWQNHLLWWCKFPALSNSKVPS